MSDDYAKGIKEIEEIINSIQGRFEALPSEWSHSHQLKWLLNQLKAKNTLLAQHDLAFQAMEAKLNDVQDEHKRLDGLLGEAKEAMSELLSGHDNLYVAHWCRDPRTNLKPEDDIATHAARDFLQRLKKEKKG